jgi:coenzyme F420-0:L-glutamate ligase / coenzyme F420-1:gamma-L-glutamate ligase
MITLSPIKTPRMSDAFDIVNLLDSVAGSQLRDGDVLVVSSKFVAISEGRIVKLDSVIPSEYATELASKYRVPPELCELVIRESDEIMGGVVGFILAAKDGVLAPNAGIDRSNIGPGMAVLYPRNALESASAMVDAMRFRHGVRIGMVVSDSRLMPTRRGTTGVALAAAGLEAVIDLRGREDLFGNVLRVTSQAIADDLCSAAQLVMGEADEATPFVLIRGLDEGLLKERNYPAAAFAVRLDQDVYLRSISYAARRTSPRASGRRP